MTRLRSRWIKTLIGAGCRNIRWHANQAALRYSFCATTEQRGNRCSHASVPKRRSHSRVTGIDIVLNHVDYIDNNQYVKHTFQSTSIRILLKPVESIFACSMVDSILHQDAASWERSGSTCSSLQALCFKPLASDPPSYHATVIFAAYRM